MTWVLRIGPTTFTEKKRYYGPRTLPVDTPEEAMPFTTRDEAEAEALNLRASGLSDWIGLEEITTPWKIGDPKPVFAEGQVVDFNLDGKMTGIGRIRGCASEHIIDFWIVEVDSCSGVNPKLYPWSCISVPHPHIKPVLPVPSKP